ncbi:hypothetical protein FHS27_004656 [Rhodopirellula rubra]|uniref:Uncharacterized protein n=1 Tax=Aporhodopirellula rubra TaxID=980271 RepID=A0A7W5H7W3_9BACT|nr:hypothetical protein [Aporhodopirellula rubra]
MFNRPYENHRQRSAHGIVRNHSRNKRTSIDARIEGPPSEPNAQSIDLAANFELCLTRSLHRVFSERENATKYAKRCCHSNDTHEELAA